MTQRRTTAAAHSSHRTQKSLSLRRGGAATEKKERPKRGSGFQNFLFLALCVPPRRAPLSPPHEREAVHRTKERVLHLLLKLGGANRTLEPLYHCHLRYLIHTPPRSGGSGSMDYFKKSLKQGLVDFFIDIFSPPAPEAIYFRSWGDCPECGRRRGTKYSAGEQFSVQAATGGRAMGTL